MAPLRDLARQIVRLSDEHGLTPVLVVPSHLSLRPPFFKALVDDIANETERKIRIDWCRAESGPLALLKSPLNRWRCARMTRELAAKNDATVVLTASIARPGGPNRDLVIGLCDETLDLPPWTTAIRIGA